MTGMIWDEMQRLKLAMARLGDDLAGGFGADVPAYLTEAVSALEDAIAEAWPPEPKRGKPWKPEPMVVMLDEADAPPQLEAAELTSVADLSFLATEIRAKVRRGSEDKALIEQYRRSGILTSRTDDLGK